MKTALKKMTAPAKPVAKTEKSVAVETLRLVDVKPVAKADLSCAVSKRGLASILALAVILGYKAEKKVFEAFVQLTGAYRHGENTTKETTDGGSNNMVYLRHATAGINGAASHSWAKDCIEKLSEKDIASAVKALAMDKKAVMALAKKSKNPLAVKLAKVA